MSQTELIESVLDRLPECRRSLIEGMSDEEKLVLYGAVDQMSRGDQSIIQMLIDLDYEITPPTIKEFISDDYWLGRSCKDLYEKWVEELEYVFSPDRDIYELILTGAIGTGKTTVAVVATLYKIAILLCMRSPQRFYGLLERSLISFGAFNINLNAAEIGAHFYLRAYMEESLFFRERFETAEASYDLPKDLAIVVGSRQVHAVGSNMFGGILDEMNLRRESVSTREGFNLYQAVRRRIESRYSQSGRNPGFLVLVSSTGFSGDFLEEHMEKVKNHPNVHIVSHAEWDVKPRSKFYPSGKSFRVEIGDRNRPHLILEEGQEASDGAKVIEVPEERRESFEYDLDGSLRDIAAIRTFSRGNLMTRMDLIYQCIDEDRESPFTQDTLTVGLRDEHLIQDFIDIDMLTEYTGFARTPRIDPNASRFIHVDLGVTNDALGLSMVHQMALQPGQKLSLDSTTDYTPYDAPAIYHDLSIRIVAGRNDRVDFSKVREFIRFLAFELHYPVSRVTFDSFQSEEFKQTLSKPPYNMDTGLVSVDKNANPYLALRSLMYLDSLVTYNMEILFEELSNLIYDPQSSKVDHPVNGSKDVSDSLAGAVWSLITSKQVNDGKMDDKLLSIGAIAQSVRSKTKQRGISIGALVK